MPESNPLLSIIMPVKNLDRYIKECIESILQQRFQDWELIIANDYSTDNTLSIINKFVQEDQRISCFLNDGKGIIPALELALSKAKGIYLTRFDGDDLMPKSRLQKMINAIIQAEPKTIITGKVKYFSNQQVSKGYLAYEAWLNSRVTNSDHWNWVYRECVIASPNWMVKRNDLIEIGGFKDLTYPEDYDLTLKMYQNSFKVKGLNEVTLLWREHIERTSRNSEHYSQQYFFDLKIKHFVKHKLGNSKLVLWGTGIKGQLTKNILDHSKIPFSWMDMLPVGKSKSVLNQEVTDYKSIERYNDYKLLLAIYPSQDQKRALEAYLKEQEQIPGQDFWYL